MYFSFRYFDCVDVCKTRNDWTEARVASVLPPFTGGPNEVVSMAVFSPTELDLCVYQKTSRLVVTFLNFCMFHVVMFGTFEALDGGFLSLR